MTEFIAIIVAAGTGSRLGNDTPKQYLSLSGKPVIRHSVDAFMQTPGLKDIRIVVHKDHGEYYRSAFEGLDLPEPIIGGTTRQESVRLALQSLTGIPDSIPVLIHDAARPFITNRLIKSCLDAMEGQQAASLATPVSDTLRKSQGDILGEAIERNDLWAMQTPQGALFGVLKNAHDALKAESFTDDTAILSAFGIDVKIVTGDRRNFKITTEDDFRFAESTMSGTVRTKTGLGYDVHSFGEQADAIRIGGIDIPHDRRLAGHSDADVILHAITDALYGTISSGDIGSHFPPSDNSFKNMDSEIFLKDAVIEVEKSGGMIAHIDTVVICEAPKIGPYRDAIRERIAQICGIPVSSVSIKATTSEGLGFTGRREGIACQALVTVEFKI